MVEHAQHSSFPPSRDGRLRWWDLVIAFFGGTFAGIVLAVIVGGVAVAIAMRHGYHPNAASLASLTKNFTANHVLLLISDLGLVAVVWLVARRRVARPLTYYFPPASGRALLLAVLSGLVLSLLLNGGNELLSRTSLIQFHDTDIERALVPHGAAEFLASVAVVAVFAPFVEEFFFRGLLYGWLRQRNGVWLSAVVSGVLFAAAHGHMFVHPGAQGWLYTAELALAGVVLALWVARTGSLRTSFATHAAYNAAAIAFSVLLP